MSISRVISICIIMVLANVGCTGKEHQSKGDTDLYDKVLSYWNKVDVDRLPQDSLEQQIVDYLYLAGLLNREDREKTWTGFYRKIKEHPNKTVVDYLGEPDSPLYSQTLLEEYLVNFLEYSEDNAESMRAEYLLKNVRKNRVGEKISDIKVLKDNRKISLNRLIEETGRECLIMFYDPDCSSCDAEFGKLNNIDLTGIEIITISISGTEKVVNESWISTHVADVEELDDRFYYTSLPSIYIVSKDGLILQKDVLL